MLKMDLENSEEAEIKLPTYVGSSKKKEDSRRTAISVLLTMQNFDRVDHNKLWKILQDMGIPHHLTCLLRNVYAGKKQKLELDMEQQTSSKLGKKYIKAIYCHTAYLSYMQSISYEMPGWMKHKLESRLPGKISIISDM